MNVRLSEVAAEYRHEIDTYTEHVDAMHDGIGTPNECARCAVHTARMGIDLVRSVEFDPIIERRPYWTTRRLIVLAIIAGALTLWITPSRADAATVQSNGGAVWSSAWTAGMFHPTLGWNHAVTSVTTTYDTHDKGHGRCVVKVRDGHAKVGCHDGQRHTLRPCPEEDSRNCYWQADTMGNGRGHSFIDMHGRTDYLRVIR